MQVYGRINPPCISYSQSTGEQVLNDPHVEALIYAIEHDRSVNYEWAIPMEVERQGFCLNPNPPKI